MPTLHFSLYARHSSVHFNDSQAASHTKLSWLHARGLVRDGGTLSACWHPRGLTHRASPVQPPWPPAAINHPARQAPGKLPVHWHDAVLHKRETASAARLTGRAAAVESSALLTGAHRSYRRAKVKSLICKSRGRRWLHARGNMRSCLAATRVPLPARGRRARCDAAAAGGSSARNERA